MPGGRGIKRVSLSPCRAQGDGERAVPHVPKTAVREGGGGGAVTSEGPQPGSPAPPRARARGSCAGGWLRRALSGSDAGRRRWELDEEGDRASERMRALLCPCERTRVVQPRLGADRGVRRAGGTRATALGGAHVGPAGRGPAWGARGCWVNPEPRQGRRRLVDVRRSVHHLRRGGGNSAVRGDAGGAAGPRARRGEPDPGADAALPSVRDPRGRVRGAGREGGRGQPCGHAAEKGRA